MSTVVLNPADIRYVTTTDGEPSDVIIPFELWKTILRQLDAREDDGMLKPEVKERLLRQLVELKAGTAELVSFDDVLQQLSVDASELN